MKHIFLSIPDDQYRALHACARHHGQRDNDYILKMLKSDLDTNQTYGQKNSLNKTLQGSDIIDHDDLVLLGGIYYNYRLQGEGNDDHAPKIDENTTYRVVGLDGNIAVLEPKN